MNSTKVLMIRIQRNSFPFNRKWLNFNAINLMLLIRSTEEIATMGIVLLAFNSNGRKIKLVSMMAFAGVGNPINSED